MTNWNYSCFIRQVTESAVRLASGVRRNYNPKLPDAEARRAGAVPDEKRTIISPLFTADDPA